MSSQDQPSREQRRRQHQDEQGRLPTVLLQHWATMVTEQGEQLEQYRTQLATVEARADRAYQDNILLHGLVNQAYQETAAHERLAMQLSALVLRIMRENPGAVREEYRDHYFSAINDFNETNPIDLTTDEELEDDDE